MARKFYFHYLFIMFEMAVLCMSEPENECFVLLKIDLIIITTSKSIFLLWIMYSMIHKGNSVVKQRL